MRRRLGGLRLAARCAFNVLLQSRVARIAHVRLGSAVWTLESSGVLVPVVSV